MKECGIYKITNKTNGKAYIGCSIDIKRRWADHVRKSKCVGDREYEKALYRAFRKYGIENFNFEIIEFCDGDQHIEREVALIAEYDTYSTGYNETYGGDIGGRDNSGESHPKHKLTEQDVIDIRTKYNNRERKCETYELYKDRIGDSGFKKIWQGASWGKVMMEVYTDENKKFHANNTGNAGTRNGRAKLTEEEVRYIRTKKKEGADIVSIYEEFADRMARRSFTNLWSGYTWKHITV